MPIFVGVDAGGTSIECVVEHNGEVRTARGEAANVRTAGVARAAERIAATVRTASRGDAFDALAAGAAGAGDFVLARALEAALREYFPGAAVAVFDDAEIALRAAVPLGDGSVLIAGTGSIAYAHIGEATHRAGGYGHLLGDDGSGFAIGRAALAHVLRWYDGRAAHSELFDAISAQLGVQDAQGLLRCVYGEPHPVAIVASVAPLVLDRAGAGDRLANKIVQAAALELVELLKALVRAAKIEAHEIPLVFAGGLFAQNSLLSYLVETRLLADLPLLHPIKSPPPPVHGALELARRMAR